MKILSRLVFISCALIVLSSCATNNVAQIPSRTEGGFAEAIDVSNGPGFLATSLFGDNFFVLCNGGTELIIAERFRGQVNSFPLDFIASQIVVGNDNSHLFITSAPTRKGSFSGVVKLNIHTGQIDRLEMESSFFSVGGKVSSDGRKLFLSNANGRYLLILDVDSFEILKKILLGVSGGFGLDMAEDDSKVYVTHAFNQSLSIVDLESNNEVTVIENVGTLPVAIDVVDNGKSAYILDNENLSIISIDLIDREVLRTYALKELMILTDRGNLKGFSPFGKVYAVAGGDYILSWNPYLKKPVMLNLVKNTSNFVDYDSNGVAFNSRQNVFVFSNYAKNEIRVFDLLYFIE